MKKILVLALALIMLLGIAACGPKPADPTPTAVPAKTLNVAHKADPTSLCHLTVTFGSANGPIDAVIYDRLLDYDATTNNVKPMLATKWEYVDDTHIKFTLREDVVAHDGNKFSASDVLYTLKTGVDSGKLGNYYGNFDIAGCQVVDAKTIIIATKTADPFALYNLSNIPLGMVVEKSVKDKGELSAQNDKPTAATGPYKVVEWVNGSYIKLARNESYWGEKPYYDFIEFKIISEASSRVIALESGDVDICLDPATSQLTLVQDASKFAVVNYTTSNVTTLYLNCTKAPFDDVKLRQAVALAIDYEGDLKNAAGGYGITTDSFLPKNSTAYVAPDSSYTNYYHYDVAAAKKLVAESGYPNGVTVDLLIMEGAAFNAYAVLLQNQLAQIGVTVNIVPTASSAFYVRLSAGDYQAEIVNSSNPDPAVQCKYFDHRVGFEKVRGGTGWTGPAELDALIDQAASTIDPAESKALYTKIQAIINENAPAIPLYSPNKICVTDANIGGIRLTEFGDIDISRAYQK